MTTVLVTGAGGYIGGRLATRLAADGFAVRALVRAPLSWPDRIHQVVGDLVEDPRLAMEVARGVDVTIHLAGANEVETARDPDAAVNDTITAARRVAESGTPRLIYLSTVHVYGAALDEGATITEETPAAPLHPYARARLACEQLFADSSTPSVIFRLTNGVGAPTRPDIGRWSLVANELCREAATAGRVTLRSTGVQWRDFIALRDVEAALVHMVGTPAAPPGVYNLGSGRSVTIRHLAEIVRDCFTFLGNPRPLMVVPEGPPEQPGPFRVDTARLRRLGIWPQTSLEEAIEETAVFCLAHRSELM